MSIRITRQLVEDPDFDLGAIIRDRLSEEAPSDKGWDFLFIAPMVCLPVKDTDETCPA